MISCVIISKCGCSSRRGGAATYSAPRMALLNEGRRAGVRGWGADKWVEGVLYIWIRYKSDPRTSLPVNKGNTRDVYFLNPTSLSTQDAVNEARPDWKARSHIMSAEKGPNTGPTEFAGVDVTSPRHDSVSNTIVAGGDGEGEMEDFQMPDVDLQYAAGLKVSRVHGQKLLWMITFVCGTGVSLALSSLARHRETFELTC